MSVGLFLIDPCTAAGHLVPAVTFDHWEDRGDGISFAVLSDNNTVTQHAGRGNFTTNGNNRSVWETMRKNGQGVVTQTTEFGDGHLENYAYYWLQMP